MVKISKLELGRLVGLIDGEGCISIIRKAAGGKDKTAVHELKLMVKMTHEKTFVLGAIVGIAVWWGVAWVATGPYILWRMSRGRNK